MYWHCENCGGYRQDDNELQPTCKFTKEDRPCMRPHTSTTTTNSPHKHKFFYSTIIMESRTNGLEPAIFIIDQDNTVHLVTIGPDHNFCITNEGPVGSRYDADGRWCGD